MRRSQRRVEMHFTEAYHIILGLILSVATVGLASLIVIFR